VAEPGGGVGKRGFLGDFIAAVYTTTHNLSNNFYIINTQNSHILYIKAGKV
jgi:hypothetical protein